MNPSRQLASATRADSIDTTAAAWVVKRDAGLSTHEREQLRAWLAADPRHSAAMARADATATELDWPLHAGALDDVLAALELRARHRRTRRRSVTAGATVMLAIAIGMVWSNSYGTADPAVSSQ